VRHYSPSGDIPEHWLRGVAAALGFNLSDTCDTNGRVSRVLGMLARLLPVRKCLVCGKGFARGERRVTVVGSRSGKVHVRCQELLTSGLRNVGP
jgi:hypothetical protein